ncbi:hypothetical protein F4781DRAFT_107902 [Annulohypoxylon bovei var. microspora]|nr:hypothetical protein F4781DRAFT_107902 [Annulohypoxylon bovei var. microspora]
MANNPYEVEHNINAPARAPHRRRPDMSSFTSQLHQISRDPPDSDTHAHAHVGPTPVDAAGLYHLLHDQYATLALDAPTRENQAFLGGLMAELELDIERPPDEIPGVRQEFLDGLDRVPKKQLKKDDACPICAEPYLDDPYPLVVELPCDGRHTFDLECVGPWLQSKGNCPMCRHDLTKKRIVVPKEDEDEEDDVDGLYG